MPLDKYNHSSELKIIHKPESTISRAYEQESNDKKLEDKILPFLNIRKTMQSSLKNFKSSQFLSSYTNFMSKRSVNIRKNTDSITIIQVTPRDLISLKHKLTSSRAEVEIPESLSIIPISIARKTTTEHFVKPLATLHSCSTSPKLAKSYLEDEFYFENMLKNPNFTSFQLILDFNPENSAYAFPYFGKPTKVISKRKSPIKKLNMIQTNFKQPLFTSAGYIHYDSHTVFPLSEVKKNIPSLSRVYYHPRNVTLGKNLLIINVEETLGIYKSEIVIRPKISDLLKQLCSIYQVIMIIQLNDSKNQDFLLWLEIEEVKVAGIYSRENILSFDKEISKLQDYSQVFIDFKCINPNEHAFIISCHSIVESDELEDFICYKGGIITRLYAFRIPIASKEIPSQPFLYLLPSSHFHVKMEILKRVFKYFIRATNTNKESINFTSFVSVSKFKTFASTKVYEMFLKNLGKSAPLQSSRLSNNQSVNNILHCQAGKRLSSPIINQFIILSNT
ncbi:hypothetical protein SteCoe_38237 [Stentor coeruleus]|uniref:Uncharacterized protein n=1 Tax=Stentor coeruleus TaxID=5963 RepID=A0A1R2ALM7_9CILI|nr:hypothetical protein SteCoe_38237 [Stentor coeruleus]